MSNGLPYYPRYPRDFLEGTVGMPFELKGAYGLVLDLIYMMGKRGLPDDPHFISGHLGMSVRKWNVVRDKLIALSKIQAENGIISNKRADKEKIIQSKFQDKQRENRSHANKNKDLESRPSDHTESHTNTDTDKKAAAASGAADPVALMERVCEAAGTEFGALTGQGSSFGMSPRDVDALRRWQQDLKLTPEQIIAAVADKASRMRTKATTLAYFTPGMCELSAQLHAPPLQPAAVPQSRPSQPPREAGRYVELKIEDFQ